MIQDIAAIRSLPLFADLQPGDVAKLAANSRLQTYSRGAYLFLHGDDIRNFKIVCRGTVQLFRETPDGHEVTSDILIAGDCVNADEIIALQAVHRSNARIVDDAQILEVPIAWMRSHLTDFETMAPRLLQSLSDRLYDAQMEAEHRSTMSATQIVACYLQHLRALYAFDPTGFELPYSKTLIASRLRMELATFSRVLQKLKSHGISVVGTHVVFTDIIRISRLACDDCSASENCTTHAMQHDMSADRLPGSPSHLVP